QLEILRRHMPQRQRSGSDFIAAGGLGLFDRLSRTIDGKHVTIADPAGYLARGGTRSAADFQHADAATQRQRVDDGEKTRRQAIRHVRGLIGTGAGRFDYATSSTILPIWSPSSIRSCARQASFNGKIMSMTGAMRRSASSGQTFASSSAAICPLKATSRGRNVEPVWVRRLTMSRAKLAGALGPPSVAIWTMRPSTAAAS